MERLGRQFGQKNPKNEENLKKIHVVSRPLFNAYESGKIWYFFDSLSWGISEKNYFLKCRGVLLRIRANFLKEYFPRSSWSTCNPQD